MSEKGKIAVIGTGKTGSAVADLLDDRALTFNETNKATPDKLKRADAAIIFVPADAAEEVIDVLLQCKMPAVWGTTGYSWPANLPDRVKETGSRWVIGSNFSLGMQVVRKALNVLGQGVEMLDAPMLHIHEVHHVHKKDAPSGTALSWREWLGKDAAISSDRQGDVKGIHELEIKTKGETLSLRHEAHSRRIFAEGAVWTADYLLDHPMIEPGVYPFTDVFDHVFKKKL